MHKMEAMIFIINATTQKSPIFHQKTPPPSPSPHHTTHVSHHAQAPMKILSTKKLKFHYNRCYHPITTSKFIPTPTTYHHGPSTYRISSAPSSHAGAEHDTYFQARKYGILPIIYFVSQAAIA